LVTTTLRFCSSPERTCELHTSWINLYLVPLVGFKVISLHTGSDSLFVTLNQQQTVTSVVSVTKKLSILAGQTTHLLHADHLTAPTKCSFWIWFSLGPWSATAFKKSNVDFEHNQVGSWHKIVNTAENAASGFRKAGLYPCNSNIFGPHKFLVAEKDSEQTSVEPSRNFNKAPPVIKLLLIQLQLSTFLPYLNFVRNDKWPMLEQVHPKWLHVSSPYKNLVDDAKKNKPVKIKNFKT
jgi:hypothetical protein